jgi:predicted kinase
MDLWAIYIFLGSVCLFGCSKIGRPIQGIYTSQIHECGNWEKEHYNSVLEIAMEYINRNQTLILDSHWPFICSLLRRKHRKVIEDNPKICAS